MSSTQEPDPHLIIEFVQEAEEGLQEVEQALLEMEQDPDQWEDEEEIGDQLDEEDEMDEIIRKCWMREFETMSEVVEALKVVIVGQGLEINGDDVVVDDSVGQFEGAGVFAEMIKISDGVST